MSETVTSDGLLARHIDGGFAISFPEAVVGEEAIDELTSAGVQQNNPYKVIGRSALGVVAGVDIAENGKPAQRVDGSLYIPIDITAHAEPGRLLLARLQELRLNHDEGTAISWDESRLAFGRLLHLRGLEQLADDELQVAIEKHLLGFGKYGDDSKPDVQVQDDVISMPLAPWELKPDLDVFGKLDNLRQMLREGVSGRAFALDHMIVESRRRTTDTLGDFVVGNVLLSPGPYFCEVIRAVSPNGSMTQLRSAAWLDADRSRGLHLHQSRSHRGRQVEVVNENTA